MNGWSGLQGIIILISTPDKQVILRAVKILSSGIKYGIYAHGSEAIELYQETKNMLKVQHLVDIIIDICT